MGEFGERRQINKKKQYREEQDLGFYGSELFLDISLKHHKINEIEILKILGFNEVNQPLMEILIGNLFMFAWQ